MGLYHVLTKMLKQDIRKDGPKHALDKEHKDDDCSTS